MKLLSTYIKQQNDFRVKWKEFHNQDVNFDSSNYCAQLTPFFGTEEFKGFSEDEKKKLFFEYIKLVSEAIILFEQILVFAVWQFRRSQTKMPDETQNALKQFCIEEVYHSQGFRHFLSSNPCFNWKESKIYAHSHRLRFLIMGIIKFAPSAVFLPGAKLEAFTLSYYSMVKKEYKDEKNGWVYLNHIHQLDESFHLPIEFEFHDQLIESTGKIKTWFGMIGFVSLMQVALFIGTYRLISYALPQRTGFEKFKLTLKMAKWAVRLTPAYKEARKIISRQFESKKPKWARAFAFLYW